MPVFSYWETSTLSASVPPTDIGRSRWPISFIFAGSEMSRIDRP
ncbi:hypothetical protein [Nonomuraea dietziae]|uniref:Uncharacterized protein n=1 Tax=Nonomuraea dietziae TaxID=65515 RepID=A0A7W5VED0_9ACTN|nr:hypothetical protein [Nonomuraea dietziae]MBB3729910.1 hypothetical protein [Nonomuraea dietziae]